MLDAALKYLCPALLGVVLAWFTPVVHAQLPNQLPPDANNQPNSKPAHEHPLGTKEVQEKLQKAFDNKNAAYAGSSIQTSVDDQSVTLNGSVTSELQHEMALQLVRAYGEDRKIVDHLAVKE